MVNDSLHSREKGLIPSCYVEFGYVPGRPALFCRETRNSRSEREGRLGDWEEKRDCDWDVLYKRRINKLRKRVAQEEATKEIVFLLADTHTHIYICLYMPFTESRTRC